MMPFSLKHCTSTPLEVGHGRVASPHVLWYRKHTYALWYYNRSSPYRPTVLKGLGVTFKQKTASLVQILISHAAMRSKPPPTQLPADPFNAWKSMEGLTVIYVLSTRRSSKNTCGRIGSLRCRFCSYVCMTKSKRAPCTATITGHRQLSIALKLSCSQNRTHWPSMLAANLWDGEGVQISRTKVP